MTIRMITRLSLLFLPFLFAGCASDTPQSIAIQAKPQQGLTGSRQLVGSWVVAAIGGREVVGRYAPRIAFGDDERVGGIAGCNRFLGNYRLGKGGALSIGKMKLTRRLCPASVMVQEALFLNRLRDVESSTLIPDGELLIYSGQYKLPIRLRPVPPVSQVSDGVRHSQDG